MAPIFEVFNEAWGDSRNAHVDLDNEEEILENDQVATNAPLALEDGAVGDPESVGERPMAGVKTEDAHLGETVGTNEADTQGSTTEIEAEENHPALMKGLSAETLIMGQTDEEKDLNPDDDIPPTQPRVQTPSPCKGKRYGFYSPETQYYGSHLPPTATPSQESDPVFGSTGMPPPKMTKEEIQARMAALRPGILFQSQVQASDPNIVFGKSFAFWNPGQD